MWNDINFTLSCSGAVKDNCCVTETPAGPGTC